MVSRHESGMPAQRSVIVKSSRTFVRSSVSQSHVTWGGHVLSHVTWGLSQLGLQRLDRNLNCTQMHFLDCLVSIKKVDLKVFSHFSDEILTFVFARSSGAALVYKSLSCSPGRQRLFTLSENMLGNKEGRIFHVHPTWCTCISSYTFVFKLHSFISFTILNANNVFWKVILYCCCYKLWKSFCK